MPRDYSAIIISKYSSHHPDNNCQHPDNIDSLKRGCMGGFAKVDNGLGLILISTRRGYRGTEAYEKKGQTTLSFTSQKKEQHLFYIYDEIASPKKEKALLIATIIHYCSISRE